MSVSNRFPMLKTCKMLHFPVYPTCVFLGGEQRTGEFGKSDVFLSLSHTSQLFLVAAGMAGASWEEKGDKSPPHGCCLNG